MFMNEERTLDLIVIVYRGRGNGTPVVSVIIIALLSNNARVENHSKIVS